MVQSWSSTEAVLATDNSEKKADGTPPTKNLFELVDATIPKSYQSFRVSKSYQDNLNLAKSLIHFLDNNFQKELNEIDLEVNNINGICQLNAALSNIIFEKGLSIHFGEEQKQLYILEQLERGIDMVFLEAKHLYMLPSEPLRIGYAYALKHLENSCPHAFIGSNFESIKGLNHYDEIGFFLEMEEEEEGKREVKNSINRYLRRAKKAKKFYQKYLDMDLDIFFKYNPKDQYRKNVKQSLIEVLKINPNILDHFAESDSDSNGYASFRYFKSVVVDLDENLKVDYYYGESIVENANGNGWTEPMAYHLYQEGNLVEKTKQVHINEYYQYEAALSSLRNTL